MNQVRWTAVAVEDLSAICDFTELHFGADQAQKAANAIYDAAERLARTRFLGRPGRKFGTREFKITGLPFVIIYVSDTETVEILRVLHGARQWPESTSPQR